MTVRSELAVLTGVADQAARRRVIGVEREYEVARHGRPTDVRDRWSTWRGLGVALDPGDANARRTASGAVVTMDGREVEVATPPVPLGPGCTRQVLAQAAAGARHLSTCLPADLQLRGYSTHISVEVDDRRVNAAARLIADRLALALMLTIDRACSPGLLVRPRHGRLEIGGEFTAGRQLRAAVAITAAVVLLGERAAADRAVRRGLPPRLPVRLERAVERYGWYVDRRAFGPDLYVDGRAAILRAGRRTISADDVLEATWTAARSCAEEVLAVDELMLVDRLVDGSDPLPLEESVDDDGSVDAVPDDRSYRRRDLGAFSVAVVAASWWRATLEVRSEQRVRWLMIPGRALETVLDGLDDGSLGDELGSLVLDPQPSAFHASGTVPSMSVKQ